MIIHGEKRLFVKRIYYIFTRNVPYLSLHYCLLQRIAPFVQTMFLSFGVVCARKEMYGRPLKPAMISSGEQSLLVVSSRLIDSICLFWSALKQSSLVYHNTSFHMFALTRQNFELFLLILVGIFTFLTYSPQDDTSFWMYWVSQSS